MVIPPKADKQTLILCLRDFELRRIEYESFANLDVIEFGDKITHQATLRAVHRMSYDY